MPGLEAAISAGNIEGSVVMREVVGLGLCSMLLRPGKLRVEHAFRVTVITLQVGWLKSEMKETRLASVSRALCSLS